MTKYISYEKLLSFWIILYSIGYISNISNIFKYNPIILLGITYVFVILSMIYILSKYNKNTQIYYLILINTVIKLPFIILLWNRKITITDIAFTILFIIAYVIYMKLIDEDIICNYRDIIIHIINYEDGGLALPLFPIYKHYIS